MPLGNRELRGWPWFDSLLWPADRSACSGPTNNGLPVNYPSCEWAHELHVRRREHPGSKPSRRPTFSHSKALLRWSQPLMAQHTKSTWAKDSIILGLKLFPQISFKCNVQHTVKGNWADGERRQHKRESAVAGDMRRQPGSLHWRTSCWVTYEQACMARMKPPAWSGEWALPAGLQMSAASIFIRVSEPELLAKLLRKS